jgi:hypothetical protein
VPVAIATDAAATAAVKDDDGDDVLMMTMTAQAGSRLEVAQRFEALETYALVLRALRTRRDSPQVVNAGFGKWVMTRRHARGRLEPIGELIERSRVRETWF